MSNQPEMNRAKMYQLALFPLNNGATNVYFVLILTYIATFGNKVLGLAMVFASVMVTGMRVFDAITDPIIGALMDKTNTKFGKFRMENYPIKWVCNFKGQRAIGICGKTQKIAMFASDERVSRILDDIVIGTDEAQEGYGCEEKDRCCNFECEYCEISPRQYLQITGKKPSNKNITDLINGLIDLNLSLEADGHVPFEEYEVVKL